MKLKTDKQLTTTPEIKERIATIEKNIEKEESKRQPRYHEDWVKREEKFKKWNQRITNLKSKINDLIKIENIPEIKKLPILATCFVPDENYNYEHKKHAEIKFFNRRAIAFFGDDYIDNYCYMRFEDENELKWYLQNKPSEFNTFKNLIVNE